MATSTSQETENITPPTTNSPWIAPPGYYPNKEWGNTFAYWDGERWSEMAEADRPASLKQTPSSGFKYHPVKKSWNLLKTSWNLLEATLQLAVSIGLFILAIVIIYAVIATGGGTHP